VHAVSIASATIDPRRIPSILIRRRRSRQGQPSGRRPYWWWDMKPWPNRTVVTLVLSIAVLFILMFLVLGFKEANDSMEGRSGGVASARGHLQVDGRSSLRGSVYGDVGPLLSAPLSAKRARSA
jgi:hypothetical protein